MIDALLIAATVGGRGRELARLVDVCKTFSNDVDIVTASRIATKRYGRARVTRLIYAATTGDLHRASFLLDCGADVEVASERWARPCDAKFKETGFMPMQCTPLACAAAAGKIEMISLLLARGASMSVDAWLAACYAGQSDVLEFFQGRGMIPALPADLEAWTSHSQARKGSPFLHASTLRDLTTDVARRGHAKVLVFLLGLPGYSADMELVSAACYGGDAATTAVALDIGSFDVAVKPPSAAGEESGEALTTDDYEVPSWYTSEDGMSDYPGADSDIDAQNEAIAAAMALQGLMHCAASRGHLAVLQLLLDRGAPLEGRWSSKPGSWLQATKLTPLAVAAEHLQPEAVSFLLARGANPEGAIRHTFTYCRLRSDDSALGGLPRRKAQLAVCRAVLGSPGFDLFPTTTYPTERRVARTCDFPNLLALGETAGDVELMQDIFGRAAEFVANEERTRGADAGAAARGEIAAFLARHIDRDRGWSSGADPEAFAPLESLQELALCRIRTKRVETAADVGDTAGVIAALSSRGRVTAVAMQAAFKRGLFCRDGRVPLLRALIQHVQAVAADAGTRSAAAIIEADREAASTRRWNDPRPIAVGNAMDQVKEAALGSASRLTQILEGVCSGKGPVINQHSASIKNQPGLVPVANVLLEAGAQATYRCLFDACALGAEALALLLLGHGAPVTEPAAVPPGVDAVALRRTPSLLSAAIGSNCAGVLALLVHEPGGPQLVPSLDDVRIAHSCLTVYRISGALRCAKQLLAVAGARSNEIDSEPGGGLLAVALRELAAAVSAKEGMTDQDDSGRGDARVTDCAFDSRLSKARGPTSTSLPAYRDCHDDPDSDVDDSKR